MHRPTEAAPQGGGRSSSEFERIARQVGSVERHGSGATVEAPMASIERQVHMVITTQLESNKMQRRLLDDVTSDFGAKVPLLEAWMDEDSAASARPNDCQHGDLARRVGALVEAFEHYEASRHRELMGNDRGRGLRRGRDGDARWPGMRGRCAPRGRPPRC